MGFKTRDKIEMGVAALILLVFIAVDLFAVGPEDPSTLFKILVLAAAFTMFGDNVAKAREFL